MSVADLPFSCVVGIMRGNLGKKFFNDGTGQAARIVLTIRVNRWMKLHRSYRENRWIVCEFVRRSWGVKTDNNALLWKTQKVVAWKLKDW